MGRRQAARNLTGDSLVLGDKSFPLDNIQFDIVSDDPVARKLPTNVRITPINKPPTTPPGGSRARGRPRTRPPAPVNKTLSSHTRPPIAPLRGPQGIRPPGLRREERPTPGRRTLPVKRAASPEIIIENEIKVSKSVKITPLSQDLSTNKFPVRQNVPLSERRFFNQSKSVNINTIPATSSRSSPASTKIVPSLRASTKFVQPSKPSPVSTKSAPSSKALLTSNKFYPPSRSSPAPIKFVPQSQAAPPSNKYVQQSRPSPAMPPGPPGPPGPQKKEVHMCDECGKNFKTSAGLVVHQESVHAIRCEECGQKFDTELELTRHRVSHLEKCFYCEQMFRTSLELEDHLELSHEKKCSQSECESRFYTEEALEDHVKECHYFPCSKCPSILSSLEELTEHTQLLHTFICDYNNCTFVVDEREKLVEHEKLVHQRCEECEDEFTWTDPDHHKCYYTSNKVSPLSDRVQVQNLYFSHISYYFI